MKWFIALTLDFVEVILRRGQNFPHVILLFSLFRDILFYVELLKDLLGFCLIDFPIVINILQI